MVESTRLESERTGNRTVGSNPTLSAIIQISLRTSATVYFWCTFIFQNARFQEATWPWK